jgi:hypothetical protein
MSSFKIIFRANCIDGWFSSYIAYTVLKTQGSVEFIPASPNHPNTWPNKKQLSGSHILLLDISFPEQTRNEWSDVLSIMCIDHHIAAVEHWPVGSCPIDDSSCSAIQTWKYFYPGIEVPMWIHHIDRIDRWINPTYEDRCVREVANIIAHKPGQKLMDEAITMTEQYIHNMNTPAGILYIIAQGKVILDKKDAELFTILNKGVICRFTEEHIRSWNLPQNWLNVSAFIIDNTKDVLDTTEAAHLVFTHYQQVNIFINYREKLVSHKGKYPKKYVYMYNARSRGVDLTNCTIFKGHPNSAGASVVKGDIPYIPFVLTAV